MMRGSVRRVGRALLGVLAGLGVGLFAGCVSSEPALKTAKGYTFWPPFPDKPRIQFLVSYRSSYDVEPPRSDLDKLIYGKDDAPSKVIDKPYGVAFFNGKIYVCDTVAGLTVLDLVKHEMRLLGISGAGKLAKPLGVAVAPDGTIYVADTSIGVVVYDANEHYLAQFGHKGLKAVNVAVHGDVLYVCDYAAGRIEVLDRHTGNNIRYISNQGTDLGQLRSPVGLAVDNQGDVFVTDVLACRFEKFDPSGKFLSSIGTLGDVAGTFTRPKHVAVDSEGIVYVVDAAFQNIQLFDAQNRLLTDFGGPGKHKGNMELPAGISVYEGNMDLFKKYLHPAFQADRLILVTNQLGMNKVAVYALGHEKEGMSVGKFTSEEPTTQPEGGTIFSGIPGQAPKSQPD